MKYVRTIATPEGGSRFEDVDVPTTARQVVPGRPAFASSATIATAGAALIHIETGLNGDWHPSSRRWFVFTLMGEIEAMTTDGEVRRFGPGSIWLIEDTIGRGHNTRVLAGWNGFGVDLAEQSAQP